MKEKNQRGKRKNKLKRHRVTYVNLKIKDN